MRTLFLCASSLLVASALAGCNAKDTARAARAGGRRARPGPGDRVARHDGRLHRQRGRRADRGRGGRGRLPRARHALDGRRGHDVRERAARPSRAARGARRRRGRSARSSQWARRRGRAAMGTFPAGKYKDVAQLKSEDNAVVAQLAPRAGTRATCSSSAPARRPLLLAADASLVAAAYGRAVVLAGREPPEHEARRQRRGRARRGRRARSARGHARRADAPDRRRGRVRRRAARRHRRRRQGRPGSPRSTRPPSPSRPGSRRLRPLLDAGRVLVSVSRDGTDEKVLTAPALDAKPFKVMEDGQIFGSRAPARSTSRA